MENDITNLLKGLNSVFFNLAGNIFLFDGSGAANFFLMVKQEVMFLQIFVPKFRLVGMVIFTYKLTHYFSMITVSMHHFQPL